MTRARGNEPAYEGANGAVITVREANAIAALMRLAKRWPDTLTLVPTGDLLCVIHTGDERFHEHWPANTEAVIAHVGGILNAIPEAGL
jgi:hypothetical protein